MRVGGEGKGGKGMGGEGRSYFSYFNPNFIRFPVSTKLKTFNK